MAKILTVAGTVTIHRMLTIPRMVTIARIVTISRMDSLPKTIPIFGTISNQGTGSLEGHHPQGSHHSLDCHHPQKKNMSMRLHNDCCRTGFVNPWIFTGSFKRFLTIWWMFLAILVWALSNGPVETCNIDLPQSSWHLYSFDADLEFHDVTLAFDDDQKSEAHKTVLLCWSPFLGKALSWNWM